MDPCEAPGQGPGATGFAGQAWGRLNLPMTVANPDSSYRLAPALGARLVGRSLVTLAVLVVIATLVGLATGTGWRPAGVVTLVGVILIGAWAWWLLRRATAVRLSGEGYAVRLLGGIGATAARWASVEEVVAASPGGQRCLVLRLTDGRQTRLPMAALAADPDAVAHDVQRRVRDAHTPRSADQG